VFKFRKDISLAKTTRNKKSSNVGGGKGANKKQPDQLYRDMHSAMQKQQGEIDGLKDVIKDYVERTQEIKWDIGVNEINICDLSLFDDSVYARVTDCPATYTAIGTLVSGLCSYFSKNLKLAVGVGTLIGAASAGAALYLSDPVIKRVLYYRVANVLSDSSAHDAVDDRPSYDSSRSLVDGVIYECTPFIRIHYMSGRIEDSYELSYDDPDRESLLSMNLFQRLSWFTSIGAPQYINAAMTKEVLTRRTLPEKASTRVRRILATHDRLCGSTDLLLASGHSDYKDTSTMCELIISRQLDLKLTGRNESYFMATVQATLLLISLMPLLKLILKSVRCTVSPVKFVPQLPQAYRGT
jgi:hypothetical protein